MPQPFSRYVALFFALAVLLHSAGGVAQLPLPLVPQPGTPTTSSTIEAAPAKEIDATAVKERLTAVRQELERIEAPGGLAAGAPPNTLPRELNRRRFLLLQLVRNYELSLAEQGKLREAQRQHTELERRIREGAGFSEKPPYSFQLVEDLRKRVQTAGQRIKVIESRQMINAQKQENRQAAVREAEEQLRRLQEQQERSRGAIDTRSLAWQRDQANLARRAAATGVAALELSGRRLAEELATTRKEFTFLEQQLEVVQKQARFTEQDLQTFKANLAQRRTALEGELEKSLEEVAAAQKAQQQAIRSLNELRANLARRPASGAETGRLARLEQLVALRQLQTETASQGVETLREIQDALRVQELFWESRYADENGKDPVQAKAAAKRFMAALEYLKPQEQALRDQLELKVRQVGEQQSRLTSTRNSAEEQVIQGTIDTYRQQETLLLRRLAEVSELRDLLERWQERFTEQTKQEALAAGAKYWQAAVRSFLHSAWNYEVFTAEDTVEVDGQKVTGKRSVTVGKMLVALLILVLGYWLSALATRIALGVVVKRYGIDPARARLARTWMLSLIVLFLVIFSLTSVKIPLTVFAFLGGAVAIGAGFGMQVLLKNLISGLMLLAEKPFQLGDIVEVEGVRGTVTTIGVRSSTIRDLNGIETLVPNSTFIEKNVTNWTYSSSHVRFTVRVGVAYGSPTTEVRDLLLAGAARHGLVLQDPPPQVLLEEFGGDALIFALNYWLDLTKGADSRAVASDLRIMVEKAMAEQGIVIAFPQRDVHLDTRRPLQVEVVQGPSGLDGGGPAQPKQ